MDYNNLIIPKLVDYIKNIVARIEASSHEGAKIELDKYQSVDTNNLDVNYLVSHGMTGSFTLKFYFKITTNGVVEEFTEDLEVPKMVNNLFVIDGDLRIPTNTLDNDNVITVYTSNVRINDLLNIEFTEDEYSESGWKLTITRYDDEEDLIIDGTSENFDTHRELLKLDQVEIDKLKVKLDTDDIGEYLTRDMVIRLIELGSDKNHDNMIDKKIYSPESNLMSYMWSRDIRQKIISKMKHKFYQYNHIYLRDIQNALDRYFRIASEQNISLAQNINPLVFDAMRYKVQIPENVSYNETMTDILDVANTPINGHVNQINEMNVCAEIKNDVLYIKCYEFPSGTPVSIPYTHYCTKKVLVNQYWDYDQKKIKDDVKEVKYKLRMKYRVGSRSESFDYIEPMPDDKLSITTRRIPLGNISDSVRVSMATGMMKQAVELAGSEPSLVTTGHDDIDYEMSALTTRHIGDRSIVTKIKGNKIFVKDEVTNSVQFYEIPDPNPGMNDSIISFDPIVKVGDILNNGDPVVVPHMLKRRNWELGTNANAVYINYLGYTYEDGIVISESFAKRLTHYQLIDVVKELYPDDVIKYIKKVGSRVDSRDVLINLQTRLRVSANIRDTYTSESGLLRGMGISYKQSNLLTPNNVDEGYILDCRIELIEGRELTNDESIKTIEDFKENYKVDEYTEIPDKFKGVKAIEHQPSDRACGYISYKIIKVDKAKIGDKLANRWGSKGIVSLVMPDECMPVIEDDNGNKTVSEIILNPAGVLHRKNISQIYECALTKCIREIYRRISILISDGKYPEAKQLLHKFYGTEFDNMSNEEFINNHKSKGIFAYQMKVGFFSKVTYDQVQEWLKDLGLSETERIFLPDITLVERSDGLKVFPMNKYLQLPGDRPTHHELGYTEQPCVTGLEYMVKLYHSASYSGKVTSSITDVNEPYLGRGNYRIGAGQKIGEQELWILLESGSEKFLQDQSLDMIPNQYIFLNELLMAGYTITDKDNNPLLSNARTKLRELQKLEERTSE